MRSYINDKFIVILELGAIVANYYIPQQALTLEDSIDIREVLELIFNAGYDNIRIILRVPDHEQ